MTSIYFLLLVFSLVFSTEIPEEEGILVLSNDNFDEVIESHEFVLIAFYAPWCGHCRALAPEYTSAAQTLLVQNSKIRLAKVDVTVETDLANKYKIKGYPTVKFFTAGKIVEYNGGNTADAIIQWLEKKTGPPAVRLTSVEQAKLFVNSKEVVVVGFFNDFSSASYNLFVSVASAVDSVSFGVTSAKVVYDEFRVSRTVGIVLFKKFDEGRNDYSGKMDENDIKQFIAMHQLPIVIEFSDETAQKIFNGDIKMHCMVFFGKTAENSVEIRRNVETAAKSFLGKVLFVHVNTDAEENDRLLEMFGMTKSDAPSFRVINLADHLVKFKPDNANLTVANLESFVQSVLDGKVAAHLLSQEIPDDWDSNLVKVLVGKNFNSVARDQSKNVIVEYCMCCVKVLATVNDWLTDAPWCGHCKKLAPIWDELADLYKDKADLIVAKMDSTTNEVDGISIQAFPTIKYFPKDSDKIISYGGEMTLEGFKMFLDSNGTTGAETTESDTEETLDAAEPIVDGAAKVEL